MAKGSFPYSKAISLGVKTTKTPTSAYGIPPVKSSGSAMGTRHRPLKSTIKRRK